MASISRRTLLHIASGATLVSLPCSPAVRSAQASNSKLVFGGSIPFSGQWGEIGQYVNAGYQTVAKFINQELGGLEVGGKRYDLEVRMVDDASDPQRAVALVQRSIDDGTRFLLGSYSSGIVLPTAAIAQRARLPLVQAGGGADAIFTQGNRWVFGIFPRASRSAWPAVELFKAIPGNPRKVAVAYTNDPFSKPQGEGVKARLLEAGFEITDEFGLPPQLQDVSPMMAALRRNPPDIFAALTSGQPSVLIARQLAASGTYLKLPFISVGPQQAGFVEALGSYADGFVCISTWDPSYAYKDPFFGTTANYVNYFKRLNGEHMVYHHGTSAGAMVAYCLAIQKVGRIDDPAAVRDALAAMDVETLYGPVVFTRDGDGDPIRMGSGVTQRQNGKLQMIFPERLATTRVEYPIKPWSNR